MKRGWICRFCRCIQLFCYMEGKVENMGIIMLTAFNAIGPVIALTALGYILKQKGFLNESFAKTANRLVFYVALPAMLFLNIYSIETLSGINWSITIYGVAAALVIFLVGMLVAMAVTRDPLRRGVVLQCSFRSNFAIIGLPMATALGGAGAVAAASVISSASIPVYNVLAVIALTMFLEGEKGTGRVKTVLANVLRNPLIWGVVTGLIALGIRELQILAFGSVVFSVARDLKLVYSVLTHLKGMTTPLALIVLGAQFKFSAVRGLGREIVAGTLCRTVISPLIGIGGAIVLSNHTNLIACTTMEYPALVALFGSPVAVSSAVMADSMGNDRQLAAQLVVWTSLVSMFTVFAMSCILMYYGYLPIL